MKKNPFAAHYAKETAKLQAEKQAEDDNGGQAPGERTAQEVTRQTITELGLQLKQIRSTQAKAEFKREHIDDLIPYVDGVMSADIEEDEVLAQDDVFMTVLLWAFDSGMLRTGRELATFASAHDWAMPPMLAVKDPAIFILTRLTEIAGDLQQPDSGSSHDLIIEIAADYAHADLHDKLGFEVQKMLGELKAESDPSGALEHYQSAANIKPKRNGLAKKIKTLTDSLAGDSENNTPVGTGL